MTNGCIRSNPNLTKQKGYGRIITYKKPHSKQIHAKGVTV